MHALPALLALLRALVHGAARALGARDGRRDLGDHGAHEDHDDGRALHVRDDAQHHDRAHDRHAGRGRTTAPTRSGAILIPLVSVQRPRPTVRFPRDYASSLLEGKMHVWTGWSDGPPHTTTRHVDHRAQAQPSTPRALPYSFRFLDRHAPCMTHEARGPRAKRGVHLDSTWPGHFLGASPPPCPHTLLKEEYRVWDGTGARLDRHKERAGSTTDNDAGHALRRWRKQFLSKSPNTLHPTRAARSRRGPSYIQPRHEEPTMDPAALLALLGLAFLAWALLAPRRKAPSLRHPHARALDRRGDLGDDGAREDPAHDAERPLPAGPACPQGAASPRDAPEGDGARRKEDA